MMETSTKMSFLIFALTILTVQGLSLNEARIKNAASSKSARAVPINQVVNARVNTLDEAADDGDDSGLFYSSSDVLPEDRDADQNLLDTLLMDIIQGTNGSTEGDLSKCQQYKPQIGEICMAKFVQRTRYRPDSEQQPDLPQQDKSSTGPLPSLSSRSPKRISSTLASPQQICCELKITYMRCLLTNLNFVCPLTEFNSEYEKVQGLTELCTRFFSKSSKKCRKRYRNKPSQVPDSNNVVTASVSVDGSSINSNNSTF